MEKWIGVDLDGTLAEYCGWKGETHIGKPIPIMVDRVKKWISEGKDVRIFTARIGEPDRPLIRETIEEWCLKNIGVVLPITNIKDFGMVELWDDRVIQVVKNTGVALQEVIGVEGLKRLKKENHFRRNIT